jgi:alkylation response protein AidB-like acyl-CoA dehydrogenase
MTAPAQPSAFDLLAEQEEFRQVVRLFTRKYSPSATVRRLMATESGYDQSTWEQLGSQLGLAGLTIDPRHGGSGGGPVELAIVMEESGRSLLGGPLFATVVLAVNALMVSGDRAAQDEYLPRIAAGGLTGTVAFESGPDPRRVTGRADHLVEGWRIAEYCGVAVDGRTAQFLIVAAQTASGPSLFAVDPAAAGVTIDALETFDLTRKQAAIRIADAPARLLGALGDGRDALERLIDVISAVWAAEQVGVAQRCLDDVLSYLGQRMQFGRVVASFQSVKHQCAELAVALELARSAAYQAAWSAASGDDDRVLHAHIARARCADVAVRTALECIQLYGGIGFTWEHDAHLFLRRAKSAQVMFGGVGYHTAAIRDHLARRYGSSEATAGPRPAVPDNRRAR